MNRQYGFTLIELIITMAIAAIVLTIGVPSFQAMMRNNRAAAHMNEFMSALNLARSEAIKRGQDVALVPNTGGWVAGWTVFVDADRSDSFNAGDTVLRVYDRLEGNPTITTGVTSIRYFNNGAISANTTQQIDYTLDSSDPTTNRTICINRVGRPHIEKDSSSCP